MRFNITDNSEKQVSTTDTTPIVEFSLKDFVSDLNNSADELQKMQKEMQAKLKAQFDVILKKFFKVVSTMKAITWVQYTPYFNDGDECIFHVRSVSVLNFVPTYISRDYEDDEGEDSERIIFGDYSHLNIDLLSSEEIKACKAVQDFINHNEDLMRDLYGNHVGVIVTENGANVRDYDHD